MYNVKYGPKYDRTLADCQIVECIQKDIVEAVDKHVLPNGLYRVQKRHCQHWCLIEVVIERIDSVPDKYSEQAKKVLSTILGILGAYNYHKSDPEVGFYDVRFFADALFSHACLNPFLKPSV